MSNCIEFYGPSRTVYFSLGEIDIPEVRRFVLSGDEIAVKNNDHWIAYWFLGHGNVTVNEDGCTISFGTGRSRHTWRDFKDTIKLLSRYVKKPRTHTFLTADESDGFAAKYNMVVDFQAGVIVDGGA